jgi:tetratricopeptide (TPR) repeat protein
MERKIKYILFTIISLAVFISDSVCQSASELIQNGFSNYNNGNYQDAVKDFDKALQSQGNYIYTETQKENYATESDQITASTQEKSYVGTTEKTYAVTSQKQYADEEVKKYVADPLEYQGDEPAKIYLYRGWTYFQMGDKDSALRDFDTAVSLDPSLSEAYFKRALLNYEVDPDKACPNLQKAIDRGHKAAKQLYDLICGDS